MPKPAEASGVSEIYELLRYAAARRQPVAATYDGQPRLVCPHVGGRKSSRLHVFCYQFGGSSNSVEPLAPEGRGVWRCLAVEKSAKSSCVLTRGTPSHAPRSRPALMKSISTQTLSPAMIRKRGSEAIAAATGAPERCVASRSSRDYVARGVRGDPRGRKSGAGPRAANLRWPARAEGEKRFLSATRNP
jgi:hypothetical protein